MEYNQEIKEAILNYYGEDPLLCLYILRDLYDWTKDELYDQALTELCREKNFCPVCFLELAVTEKYLYIGNYNGRPVYLKNDLRVCGNCSYKEIKYRQC